jgi:hypothetical protein
MISGLRIGNFKAFGAAQDIPLRPLTLVFGPNSAGKSSIIQSLLLARHIQDTGNVDAHQTTLGGAAVDLGGHARYVHKRDPEREIEIQFTFKREEIAQKFTSLTGFDTFSVAYAIGAGRLDVPGSKPRIKAAVFSFGDGQSVPLSEDLGGKFNVHVPSMERSAKVDFGDRFPVDANAIIRDLDETRSPLEAEITWYRTIFWRRIYHELWGKDFRIRGLAMENPDPLPFEESWQDWQWVIDNVDLAEGGPSEPEAQGRALIRCYEIERAIDAASEAVRQASEKITYIGPLRWVPPRFVPEGEQLDATWKAGGGEAWQRLQREPELLDRVNHFLQDTLRLRYRLECQHFALVRSAATSVSSSRIAEAPTSAATPLSQNSAETLTRLLIVDADTKIELSHCDVGTGIGQLLSVLVNAAGAERRLIAIEQPELHLHPALQAELGDVFIESALGENKNTFLIETHSEHLILRLLRRVRDTTEGKLSDPKLALRPEDISVLFVRPGKDGSEVLNLPVTADGDFACPWPGGFFAERAQELF